MVEYSPTAAKTLTFCQKRYFLRWLTKRRHAWRKPVDHPWRRTLVLNNVKHVNTWAGDLYHQAMAWWLTRQSRALHGVSLDEVTNVAIRTAEIQFRFSASKKFIETLKSRAGDIDGMPQFLALFEHAYDLQFEDDPLIATQEKVARWLATTYAWTGWPEIVERMAQSAQTYIEPQHLNYSLGGARVLARMDLGIDSPRKEFFLYDWKAYQDDAQFAAYDQYMFRQQVLAYAIWPVRRIMPTPLNSIEQVTARVFNPVTGEDTEIGFTEDDHAEFEMDISRWASAHTALFTTVPEVEFEDLRGPYDPERSCPWCPQKGVCGEGIDWASLT